MSRRVSEGEPLKKATQGVWGVEDLRKRPAPVIDLTSIASATNWCHGQKGSWSQVGTANIGWTDVDTNASSVFSVETTAVTKDTIRVATDGIVVCFGWASITTVANDWGMGVTASSTDPNTGGEFHWTAGAYNGRALGAHGAVMRIGRLLANSYLIFSITRAGTAAYSAGGFHILHFPIADTTLTDIG